MCKVSYAFYACAYIIHLYKFIYGIKLYIYIIIYLYERKYIEYEKKKGLVNSTSTVINVKIVLSISSKIVV